MLQIEAPRFYPVVITGGAGAIGSEVTKKLAVTGYQTFVILTRETRNGISAEQRFADRVRNPVIEAGGVEPVPVYADLTKNDEFREGLSIISSRLDPDQKVHYFALAATGLRGIKTSLGRVFVKLQKTMQARLLTVKDLEDVTDNIQKIVSTERGMQPAMQTNKEAAILLFDELYNDGRLSSDSSVVNLSSSPTDDFVNKLRVNAFYGAIAQGKAGGELALEDRCNRLNVRYLKVIAPVIGGTEAGDLSSELEKIIQAAGVQTQVPRGTIDQTVATLLTEFDHQLAGRIERIRTVYMAENGLTCLERPSNWPIPLLPYL